MQVEIETIIGKDKNGTEYGAIYHSVYRVEGYSANGTALGRWFSELTPFVTLGAKVYGVTLDLQAIDKHRQLTKER